MKIIAVRFHAPGVEVGRHTLPRTVIPNQKSVAPNTISIVPPIPGKRARESDITDTWPISDLLGGDDSLGWREVVCVPLLPAPA